MKIVKYLTGILGVCALFSAGIMATAADEKVEAKADATAADAKAEATPYPLSKCIVSGQTLGKMGKPVTAVYKGREIKFCCKDCQAQFDKSPEGFVEKIDAAAKEAAARNPYPLKTCLVLDEKLGGGMGAPYTFVYEDREIKLCCKSCLKTFKKEPAKYMKKLAEASAKS
jgi:YHS domain-containing protein